MELRAGQKVRVTVEGTPKDITMCGNRMLVTVCGDWGAIKISADDPDVTVEAVPFERPEWWDRARPGTVVAFSHGYRRAIKRDFIGTVAPADAETHPWMWANGTPATEDDILSWGPVQLLLKGRD